MKLLVSLANYGDKQLDYLNTVINEYKSYTKYDVTINVHTTCPIGRDDVNIFLHDPSVGRVAYLHRQEFYEKRNDYDLFLFSEGDMLIKEEAVDVYLKYDPILPPNFCIGFLRYEKRSIDDPSDDNLYLLEVWPKIGHIETPYTDILGNSFFVLTVAFQSCYLLTKEKLNLVINKTDFLRTDYPGIETSSASVFSNWPHAPGPIVRICTRELDDLKKCLIRHLPDKHCNTPFPFGSDFCSRVSTFDALLKDLNI